MIDKERGIGQEIRGEKNTGEKRLGKERSARVGEKTTRKEKK